ncbi:fimbrial protein [Escherichia coli]|uniref:Fimbrial protein n=2 Tax=Escherichia coli TaxID=562 RepID=A0AAP9MMM4_ECOLX|nr:fimbrial protein [Escherichia coli]EFW8100416.1 fimbrial protein [Shigella sonnei]EHY1704641.1 fimbrial protein [Escherichia coli O21]AUF76295.1 fimbrial protein [Escherichia coli O121:H19]AWJ26066.1 fimbrial protein [Escherichia coli O121 str. RM8352]EEC9376479.1 fimbrial protein [Escherichia coli]
MKKKTIFQCVILFFSILNIHVGMAGPEQVSMHIYGNVVDQGCDVATKSALQNIHIGDFNISDFQAANTVSTAADLNIDITGCAAGITGADVLFSGEADTLAPTLLKLTDTGGSGGMATGIAVQIVDAQSQQEIPLNQVQPLTPLKAGDNTLKYQLRYKSTKAGATGGNATAVLYFDLVYQ